VVATARLVLIIRQLREMLGDKDKSMVQHQGTSRRPWDDPCFVKDLGILLTVVFGGETMIGE
jgi:hypothetical protein